MEMKCSCTSEKCSLPTEYQSTLAKVELDPPNFLKNNWDLSKTLCESALQEIINEVSKMFNCKTTVFANTKIDWPSNFEANTLANINPSVCEDLNIEGNTYKVHVKKIGGISNLFFSKSNQDKLKVGEMKCNECEYKTDRIFNLNSHVRKKHLSIKSSHKCISCGATYARKDHYENHRRKCKNYNVEKQQTNSIQTNDKISITNHVPVQGGYQCRSCG